MNIAPFALLTFTLYAQTSQQPQATATVTTQQVAQPATQPSAAYLNDELGLAFDHPKTWKESKVKVKNNEKIVLTDPKSWHPPRTDSTTRFLLPLPGVDERGILEIFSATFNQDEDTWQIVQRDINDKMNRTVLRQWNEEVLGVPLLMTKIESKDKGVDLITETGLMYSATPRKLIFRLTASPTNFDKADYAWRQSLQSIRTTDGRLPSSEDPARKLTPKDLTPGGYHKVIWTPPTPAQVTVMKGAVSNEAAAGGKKVWLRTPAGWKVQKNSDGSFTLTSPLLSSPAKVTVASTLDSDPPGKALMRSSGATLQGFTKVLKREEKGPYANRAQVLVDWICRRGMSGTKPMFSFDSAGASGDNYWIVSWTGSDASGAARDRKALESLSEIMSVEAAP